MVATGENLTSGKADSLSHAEMQPAGLTCGRHSPFRPDATRLWCDQPVTPQADILGNPGRCGRDPAAVRPAGYTAAGYLIRLCQLPCHRPAVRRFRHTAARYPDDSGGGDATRPPCDDGVTSQADISPAARPNRGIRPPCNRCVTRQADTPHLRRRASSLARRES